MRYRPVVLLTLGHFVADVSQGALPVLLPFLIAEHDLTYAAAAGIVFATTVASSVVQPLFGHWADRLSRPWIMPAGLLLAGSGIASIGLMPSYGLILLMAILSGIGIAAYHPEGARRVAHVSGQDRATAMSYFGIGGSLGFAVGPAMATAALFAWGLAGTVIFLAPALVVAVIIASQFSTFALPGTSSPVDRTDDAPRDLPDAWGPFGLLTLVVISRAVLFWALNTFIPLYWIHVLHQSKTEGGIALSLLFVAGVFGNLLGGRLADRLGNRRIACWGFVLLASLLPAFLWADRSRVALWLLLPIGFMMSLTYSPTVVLGQQYLPNRVGLASGVTLGLAFAIGGIAAPFLGWIADLHGIRAALAWTTALPVLSTALAFTLPEPRRTA